MLLLAAGAIIGTLRGDEEPPPAPAPATAGADPDLEQFARPAPSPRDRDRGPRQREFGLPVPPPSEPDDPSSAPDGAAPRGGEQAALGPETPASPGADHAGEPAPGVTTREPIHSTEPERGPAPAVDTSPAQAARWSRQLGQSVVRVLAVTPDGTREGSGFVIGPSHVATAARVVEGATRLTVIIPRGRRVTAEIGRADTVRDVALLYCGAGLPPPVPLGDSDALRESEPLGVLGFAAGAGPAPGRPAVPLAAPTRLVALRQRRTDAAGRPELELDRVVQAEMVGGPVYLLSSGRVVGVSAPVASEEGDTGGAAPISALRALLSR